MPLSQIIAELPKLNNQELDKIIALAIRIRSKDVTPGPLYDVLLKAGGARIAFSSFIRMKQYQAWKRNEPEVLFWIEKNWPNANKVTINSLKHFLFNMLADSLKKRKIRVTVGTLALNAGDIPAIFEQSFPGYLRAGLGHVILMQLVSRNGKGG